ncbi:carbohydrate ABC transporter permease [Lacisediminihabitans changchengi]|uniref:Carbohydrate ABC transporter permease n=1 Tax=Lacisediminihabitans changchengi TaxID=2787634 RepID=A0A934SLJ5_9MICO|nr:carbohydrate ABC transporter permease [Lacisediminihabitans changchengi]MBK4348937.1 carbohydrate ABC transporter permease [Lacisediminihabitans changchengi]
MRRPFRLADTVTYVVLIAGLLITLAPFVQSLLTALKTPEQFASSPVTALPNPVTLQNFGDLLARYGFLRAALVTLAVVVTIVVVQVSCSVLAAYAFARLRFPGRDLLFWAYLGTLMVPAIVTTIPLYTLFAGAGLRDTFWGIIAPSLLGSPYAVFLLRQHFLAIPQDLLSAATLDGAGALRTLWSVAVPVSRPIIATLVVITAVSHWNNFLWPLIITSGGDWQVLTVATASLQTQYNGNWTLVMAAAVISLTPLLALFLVFQRQIVRSLAIRGIN